MKKLFTILLIFSGLAIADPGYHQNRILFCLNNDISHLQISMENGIASSNLPMLNRLLQKYEVTELRKWLRSADDNDVVGEVNLNKIYRATFTSKRSWQELQDMRVEFSAIMELHSADLESINYLTAIPQVDAYVPDDARFSEQWAIEKMQANYAWGLWQPGTPGDPEILVGVVDTGVDTQHPDLQNVLYLNPGEDLNSNGVVDPSDENGVDDDSNGYIDDFYGYDFADNDNNIRPPDAGPDQELSHGTHCTGIIAAATDNATGIAGISFRSKVIATKNARDTDTVQPGITEGYDGILYAAKLGAQFINCSWGGSFLFSYERNILDEVSDVWGAIVVGAAGNDGTDNDTNAHYPSDYSKCISVAATTISDIKAYYSNYGSVVDISAPSGEGGASSSATLSTIHANAGSYAAWQGTSMASPMVTGALALLKAWYPNQTRQWYFDEILFHADPIDDVNPSYAGELGGRLNIYNAISRNAYPYLTITSSSYTVINDNGDGELNPGESAYLQLTLENDPLWLDAADVAVTISSSLPTLTISDADAIVGTINAGSSASAGTTDLIFALTSEAAIGPLPITVTMTANGSSSYPYSFTKEVEVQAALNQPGFPITKIGMPTPVATADLLGDADLEVVAIGDDDSVYVYYADGTLASGFPVYMGAYTTMAPAIGDVDNDGSLEIVISERVGGMLKIIENDGSLLLDTAIGQQIQGEISLANMDGDADLEIIFATYSERNVYVLNYDGSYVAGFPVNYPSLFNQNIAVADLTGNGQNELVFGLFNTDFYVIDNAGNTLPNFPLNLSGRISSSPIIAEVQDDGIHIIVTLVNRKVLRIDLDGNILLDYDLTGIVQSTPALADFNNDGSLDILFGTDDSKVHVINFAGDTLAPFPLTVNGDVMTSPVVADVDDDDVLEMFVSTDDGYVYAFGPDGSSYKNFPAILGDALNGSGTLADIDRDNDYEFIVGGANGLNAIDLSDAKGSKTDIWQTYHANNLRTAHYFFDPTPSALSEETSVVKKFALEQNYPNPFNPQTEIKYQLVKSGPVQLTVFNTIGQKIATLVNEQQSAGTHNVVFASQGIPSGIYFYQLTSGSNKTIRKMVLMK